MVSIKKAKYLIALIAFAILMAYNFGSFKLDQISLRNNSLLTFSQASASWDEWGFPIYDTPVSKCCFCPESCHELRCIKVCCPLDIEGTCTKTCFE